MAIPFFGRKQEEARQTSDKANRIREDRVKLLTKKNKKIHRKIDSFQEQYKDQEDFIKNLNETYDQIRSICLIEKRRREYVVQQIQSYERHKKELESRRKLPGRTARIKIDRHNNKMIIKIPKEVKRELDKHPTLPDAKKILFGEVKKAKKIESIPEYIPFINRSYDEFPLAKKYTDGLAIARDKLPVSIQRAKENLSKIHDSWVKATALYEKNKDEIDTLKRSLRRAA